jgi:hypothetical protein
MTSYGSLSSQASTRPPSSASSRGSIHDWPLGAHDGAVGGPSHEGAGGAVVGAEWGGDGDGAHAPVDDFDNDDRQLRRLQRIVRQRLRHARETAPYGTVSGGGGRGGVGRHLSSRDDEDDARPSRSSFSTEASAAAAVAQVQRVFRSRRQDSRRRAALAIESFYIRRRRAPRGSAVVPGLAGYAPGTAPHGLSDYAPGTAPHGLSDYAPGTAPHGLASYAHGAMSSAAMGGAPHALAGGAHCGASAVESLPETAEEIAENASAESAPDPSLPFQPLPQGFGAIPGYAPSTALLGYAPSTARPGYASLIRAAQVAFRARQHRKKAVRIIEAAWSEWRFHSELGDCMLIASLIDGLHFLLEIGMDVPQ